MAEVQVPLSDATGRTLPLVSVRSGDPADGYAPAGRPVGTVNVPLTQSEFDRLTEYRRRQKSGIRGAVGFSVAGVVMMRTPLLLTLGLIIGLLSVAMWVLATVAVTRLLPAVEIDVRHGTAAFGRVHRGFVRAVEDSRSDPPGSGRGT